MLLGNDHKSNGISALPQGQGDFGALSPTTALYLLGESADDLLLMNLFLSIVFQSEVFTRIPSNEFPQINNAHLLGLFKIKFL
jgi:hypothetical protein